jgi:outer membrane protein assembly factor BamD (BamD/ComL family)
MSRGCEPPNFNRKEAVVLSPSEKAYFQALQALKRGDYKAAVVSFDRAAGTYGTDRQFVLLAETTRLLLAVKDEIRQMEPAREADTVESFIEEVFSDGEETEFPG